MLPGCSRNEDAMFPRCINGLRYMGPAWRPGREFNYSVASPCLADKFSREKTAMDGMLINKPPPFGFHDILARSIVQYGKCNLTAKALGAATVEKPAQVRCALKGFSVDRTFQQWRAYCGAGLDHLNVVTDAPCAT